MNRLLGVCRRNAWNSDTPNIAGKLENLLKPSGFTQRTRRDYVNAMMDILESEKSQGIDSSLSYEQLQEHRETESSSRKEEKGERKECESDAVIYSSALPQLINAERLYS